MYKLVYAKKLVKSNPIITILENKIDLSRLRVTAFENNNKINKDINIKNLCQPHRWHHKWAAHANTIGGTIGERRTPTP